MRRLDYHSYRGRRTFTDRLKWFAGLLVILVILALGALLVMKFFFTGEEGWQLPFGQPSSSSEEKEGGTTKLEEGEESLPLEEEGVTVILQTSVSSVLDGTAAQQLEEIGANGILLGMKKRDGALGWYSSHPIVQALTIPVEDPKINEGLKLWNDQEIYTVARLPVFRDQALGMKSKYTIQTQNRLRWWDYDKLHWASPAQADARAYYVDLMVELAEMGFDEIVLEYYGYPTEAEGYQSNMKIPKNREEGVTAFFKQASQSLQPYDLKLSIWFQPEKMAQMGLSVTVMNQYVDRIWMEGDWTENLKLLQQLGVDRAEQKLVLLTDDLKRDVGKDRALWIPEEGAASS